MLFKFVSQHLQELAVHKTVAECMIFANHWVAKKISETFPNQAVVSLFFYFDSFNYFSTLI